MELIKEQQWIFIAIIFFGIIIFISLKRWVDQQWIERKFSKNNVRVVSFGVTYYGKLSDPGAPPKHIGFLVLLKDGFCFRSRWRKVEIFVPASKIVAVYHDIAHKGTDLHQSVVKIDFLSDEGSRDGVAFKVPYPPQWIQAIESLLPEETKMSKTKTNKTNNNKG
jgi:hypothetical protein